MSITDERGNDLGKATLSNVKLTFASTACGPSGAGSPMYPEKETSPFLQWASKAWRSAVEKPVVRAVAVIYKGHVIVRGPIRVRGDGRAIITVEQVDTDGQWPYPPEVNDRIVVSSWGYL